jgi:peptidoglycan-associated lipoprotein
MKNLGKIAGRFLGGAVALLFCGAAAFGQASGGGWGEASLHVGGGLSTPTYRLSLGSRSYGLGGDVGLGYTIFLNRHVGVGAGVGVALFNAEATLNGARSVTPDLVNRGGVRYELRTTYRDYRERQRAFFVRIPLTVHYRTAWRRPLYAQAGVSMYLPLSARYSHGPAAIFNEAYYPDYGNSLTFPAYLGYGEISLPSASEQLALKAVFSASAEVGLRWQLKGAAWAIYTNLYADCGLNNAAGDVPVEDVLRRSEASSSEFIMGSVLTSRYSEGAKPFTDRVSLLSAGVRVRLAFGGSPQKSRLDLSPEAQALQLSADSCQRRLLLEELRRLAAARRSASLLAWRTRLAQEATRQRELRRPDEPALRQLEEERRERLYMADVEELQLAVDSFDIDSVALLPAAKVALAAKAELLKRYPDLQVLAEGHTCSFGDSAFNVYIGLRRAEAVKAYLVERGVAAERIRTASRGSAQPVAPNLGEANRRKNRRVEICVEAPNRGEAEEQAEAEERTDGLPLPGAAAGASTPTDSAAYRPAADGYAADSAVNGYAIDSFAVLPAAHALLNAKAELLKRYPDRRVLVEGHTCSFGDSAFNVYIGLRRAEAVKAYLVERGVAAERIRTASRGSAQPVAPNLGEANRRKNRRVEIKF